MADHTGIYLKSIIEGVIFAADEPISPKQIRELVEGSAENGESDSSDLTPQKVKSIVDALNEDYNQDGRPYRIRAVAGGYIFATNSDVSTFVGKLHKEQSKRRLTQAALETLAIIAYKQPITKVELETIRGVNSDYIVKSLLEKDLITIVGREHAVGRPLLYGTTKRFLIHFGLNSISDLPKPREIEELIGETELEVEKRLMELEKQRQDEDEEAGMKRERKPHPLAEGATARIIPLKPDYRPLKRLDPTADDDDRGEDAVAAGMEIEREEEAAAAGEGESPGVGESGRSDTGDPEPAVEIESVTSGEPGDTNPTPVSNEPEHSESIGITDAAPVDEGQVAHEEPESQRGWKKWKNKIVTIIRKFFG